MSNWPYLNKRRLASGEYASGPQDGFNGAFKLSLVGEARAIYCIASDGFGWQHVSVSFGKLQHSTPSWSVMCYVKDLFWEPDDCVIQFHPPRSNYVNHHAGCLHLWRCTDGREQPMPPVIMV